MTEEGPKPPYDDYLSNSVQCYCNRSWSSVTPPPPCPIHQRPYRPTTPPPPVVIVPEQQEVLVLLREIRDLLKEHTQQPQKIDLAAIGRVTPDRITPMSQYKQIP